MPKRPNDEQRQAFARAIVERMEELGWVAEDVVRQMPHDQRYSASHIRLMASGQAVPYRVDKVLMIERALGMNRGALTTVLDWRIPAVEQRPATLGAEAEIAVIKAELAELRRSFDELRRALASSTAQSAPRSARGSRQSQP